MLISFQIRQNEECDGGYEMKAVWWRNWMSTNHVCEESYLVTGRKNGSWQCSGFVIKSQAKEQLSDSGHVSRFFFLRYTFGELQSRVKIHFETVFFLRDIFMHITYVNM